MSNKTTHIDYDVVNQVITNLRTCAQDYEIQIRLGKIQQFFSDSRGDSANELKKASGQLKDAYQVILDMMFEMIEVLTIAKKAFIDVDTQ